MRTSRCVTLGAVLVLASACNGSREKLLADLQSPRAPERALAVRKLADQGRAEDLVLFTRAAKDLAAIVRGEAAEALGKSQDPRVVDLLSELLEDPDDDVQAKAAMALAQIKGDKSKAYLTLQYGRRGESTRIAIVQALKSANVPGAMAQVVAAEAQGIWDRNLRAFKDGSAPERVAAAEELGKSGRAEAISRLLPLVKDSQVILAAAAVRGLGYAGDGRVAPDIGQLLAENFPELREAACEALQALGDPQALPTLKAVALEKSPASAFATGAILALPRSAEIDQALCEIALGADAREAQAAAREMRSRGGCPVEPIADMLAKQRDVGAALVALQGLGPTAKAVAPKLLPYLTGNDRRMKELALRAAIELGDPVAGPAVQKIYDEEVAALEPVRADWVASPLPEKYAAGFDPGAPPAGESDPAAHDTALKQSELFRRVEEANAARAAKSGKLAIHVPPPVEIIDEVSEDQLAMLASAIRGLGALGGKGAFEIAQKRVAEASPSLRSAAYFALAHLGPKGLDAAAKGLLDPDRDVQGATATALAEQGEAGQAKVFEVLAQLPGDRLRVLDALARAGVHKGPSAPLIAIVQEGGPDTAYAARLLGEMKAQDAVEPLEKYLADPNATARRDTLWALGQIGDRKAAEVVARDLYHDSPDVRAAAADALASIGTEKQHEPLDALKGDYYRSVRERAEAALARLGAAPEPRK